MARNQILRVSINSSFFSHWIRVETGSLEREPITKVLECISWIDGPFDWRVWIGSEPIWLHFSLHLWLDQSLVDWFESDPVKLNGQLRSGLIEILSGFLATLPRKFVSIWDSTSLFFRYVFLWGLCQGFVGILLWFLWIPSRFDRESVEIPL